MKCREYGDKNLTLAQHRSYYSIILSNMEKKLPENIYLLSACLWPCELWSVLEGYCAAGCWWHPRAADWSPESGYLWLGWPQESNLLEQHFNVCNVLFHSYDLDYPFFWTQMHFYPRAKMPDQLPWPPAWSTPALPAVAVSMCGAIWPWNGFPAAMTCHNIRRHIKKIILLCRLLQYQNQNKNTIVFCFYIIFRSTSELDFLRYKGWRD